MARGLLHQGHMTREAVSALWTVAGAVGLALGLAGSTRVFARDVDAEVRGKVVGLVGACPNLAFIIEEQEIVTDADTRFEGGICRDVRSGRRVEVEGVLRSGILYARKVDLNVSAASWGPARQAPERSTDR